MEDVWKWIAGLAIAAAATVTGWFGYDLRSRIVALEDGKANRDSTNDRFDLLLAELKAHGKRLEHFDESNSKVHAAITREVAIVNTHLARIEGFLAAANDGDS